MFCGKCGAQNLDEAAFCSECGAPLNVTPSAENDAGSVLTKQPANKNYTKIGIVAVAAGVLVLILLIMGIFGGRGYKSTVNKFVDSTFSADGKKMVSLVPKKVVKYVCEESDMTKKEFIEELTDGLEDSLDYIKQSTNANPKKYTKKIIDTENISGSSLKDIKETYKDEFDIKVKAAKKVTVKVTIGGSSDSNDITVIKIGRSWYIDLGNVI